MKRKIKNALDDIGVQYYESIVKRISKKEYVSFDIFDTLIKRDVKKPTDVFVIIEHNYKICDFYKRRIEAEKRARKGKVDTTIDEIYDIYNELYLNNINEAKKIKNKLLLFPIIKVINGRVIPIKTPTMDKILCFFLSNICFFAIKNSIIFYLLFILNFTSSLAPFSVTIVSLCFPISSSKNFSFSFE